MNYRFEPSYVINGADPRSAIKRIMQYTAIDAYEEAISKAAADGLLREYILDFLSEKNKKYHGELVLKWFRKALVEQQPGIVEWFDRIQVLR